MILSKLQVIKSVGRFYNYTARGEGLDCANPTVFYGHNGHGKSTITAILRSLSTGNANLLKGRKTLRRDTTSQEVVIHTRSRTFRFDGNSWQPSFPADWRIMVFDKMYVEDNLFAVDVSNDHKKRIYSLMLGCRGQELSEQLESAMELRKELVAQKRWLDSQKAEKDRSTGGMDFLILPDRITQQEIENKIQDIQTRIQQKQSEEAIRSRPRYSSHRLSFPNLEEWRQILTIGLDNFHEDARELVRAHLKSHFSNELKGESFIAQGMILMAGETCPFCGQSLDNANTLLDAYRSYFDESYKRTKSRIDHSVESIRHWNPLAEMERISAHNEGQRLLHTQWNAIITLDQLRPDISQSLSSLFTEIKQCRDTLFARSLDKQQSPGGVVNLDVIDELSRLFEQAGQLLNEDAAWVEWANQQIESLLNSLSRQDIREFNQQLSIERAKLSRFSQEGIQFCSSYSETAERLSTTDADIRRFEEELSTYTESIFSSHQERINDILLRIGANYKIAKLEPQVDRRTTGGKANFAIAIEDFETTITGGNENEPNFRNTLSEGDRNSLAFAFFVSTLDQVPNMSHTIIVFDDPVSSLDRSRRSHLAEIIREYSGRAAQTVVLSHDDVFVLDLFTRWGNDARYIQVSADQATGSKLTPVDVREFNKTDQRKRVEALKRYLDYDDAPVETRRGDIRLVLEDALRYKYWDELETAPNNPTTLGSIIDTLVDLHRLDADVVDELRYLNNASSGAHHAQPNVLMGSAPTRESILPFIRRALSVIKKV